MLGLCLGRTAFLTTGITSDGYVTNVIDHKSSKTGVISYLVYFTYDDDGGSMFGTDTLDGGEYAQVKKNAMAAAETGLANSEAGYFDLVGKRVRIRHLAFGPWRQAMLAQYAQRHADVGSVVAWLVLWWLVLAIFYWRTWVVPRQYRWLVANGTATTGVITGKKVTSSRGRRYYVEYSFNDVATGTRIDARMATDSVGYDRVHIGYAVTVLAHPKAKRSMIYESCAYQVFGAGRFQSIDKAKGTAT